MRPDGRQLNRSRFPRWYSTLISVSSRDGIRNEKFTGKLYHGKEKVSRKGSERNVFSLFFLRTSEESLKDLWNITPCAARPMRMETPHRPIGRRIGYLEGWQLPLQLLQWPPQLPGHPAQPPAFFCRQRLRAARKTTASRIARTRTVPMLTPPPGYSYERSLRPDNPCAAACR